MVSRTTRLRLEAVVGTALFVLFEASEVTDGGPFVRLTRKGTSSAATGETLGGESAEIVAGAIG